MSALQSATLSIGDQRWTIEPTTGMAVYHEHNSDDDDAEPTRDFIIVDSANRRILLGDGGKLDSFMLGEVIVRLMRRSE